MTIAVTTRRDPIGVDVRWDAALAARWRKAGYWLDTTLARLTEQVVARDSGRVMVIEGDRRWNLTQVWEEARCVANALISQGLRPGAVIAYQIPNWSSCSMM